MTVLSADFSVCAAIPSGPDYGLAVETGATKAASHRDNTHAAGTAMPAAFRGLPAVVADALPASLPGAPPAARPAALPAALPDDARLYLRHVEGGETIRAIARDTGCHASTILRRIRRFE